MPVCSNTKTVRIGPLPHKQTMLDLHKSEQACVASFCDCIENEWSVVPEDIRCIHTDSFFQRECPPIYLGDRGLLHSERLLVALSFVLSRPSFAVFLHPCDFQRRERQVSIDRDSKLRFRKHFLSTLVGHHTLAHRSRPSRYGFLEEIQFLQ